MIEDFLVAVPPRTPKPAPRGLYVAAPRILREEPSADEVPVLEEPIPTEKQAVPQTEKKLPSDSIIQMTEHRSFERPAPVIEEAASAPAPAVVPPEPAFAPLDSGARVIGECFQTYLIAEDADGLILIDKHAAHERILFNKLRAQTDMPQQELLTPVVVELNGEEAVAVQAGIEQIRQAGFVIDDFGENSFAVRSVPAYLDSADVPSVISELADKLIHSRAAVPDRLDDLIHTVACKAAIKAGKATSLTVLQDLCDRVLADENVRSCPHGRPTTVRLTKYEIDKLFKRVNQ